MSDSIKQQEFIKLGKQLGQIEMREKTFQDNFDYLENKYNQNYSNIKIKKDMVYTKTIDFMINHIKENCTLEQNNNDLLNINYHDPEKLHLILLIKFLKLKLSLKEDELQKEINNKKDIQEMNDSFVEELEEKDKIIHEIKLDYNHLEYYSDIIALYFLPFLLFFFVNFVLLFLTDFKTYFYVWNQIILQRYNFISIYSLYHIYKNKYNIKSLIPLTIFTILTNYYPIKTIDSIFINTFNYLYYNNYSTYFIILSGITIGLYFAYNYFYKIKTD